MGKEFNQKKYLNDYRSANYMSLSFSVRPIIKNMFEIQLNILKSKDPELSISRYMAQLVDSIDLRKVDRKKLQDIIDFKKTYKESPICIKAYVRPETKKHIEDKAKAFGEKFGIKRNCKSIMMTLAIQENADKFDNQAMRLMLYKKQAENLSKKKEFIRYNRTYKTTVKYVVSDEIKSKLGSAEEVRKKLKVGDRVTIYKIPHTVRTRLWMSGHTGTVDALFEKTASIKFDPFPEAENLGIDLNQTWYAEYETIAIM